MSAMRMKLRISVGEASMGGVSGEGGKTTEGSNTTCQGVKIENNEKMTNIWTPQKSLKIAFLKTLPKTSKVGPLIAQISILG